MDDHHESSGHQSNPSSSTLVGVAIPKPPTPPLSVEVIPETAIPTASAVADPPPPYPSRERRSRAERARLRRAAHISADSGGGTLSASSTNSQHLRVFVDPLTHSQSETSPLSAEDGTEATPLLSPRRRPRTLSHSTGVSTHSITQTVASLFGTDDIDFGEIAAGPDGYEGVAPPSPRSIKRYFRPLLRMAYYRPLVHLLLINFPYALCAFLYLFVGTLTGTTLLIALPLGAVLCWLDLAGARALAKGEMALQNYFHGPLLAQSSAKPYPIFSRRSVAPATPSTLEAGDQAPPNQTSFLRNTYLMFTDQTSYQALFYFLVIKPSITLLLTLALIVLVPPSFILVVPAPAVLRAVKRIGLWQANIALEGLLLPQL